MNEVGGRDFGVLFLSLLSVKLRAEIIRWREKHGSQLKCICTWEEEEGTKKHILRKEEFKIFAAPSPLFSQVPVLVWKKPPSIQRRSRGWGPTCWLIAQDGGPRRPNEWWSFPYLPQSKREGASPSLSFHYFTKAPCDPISFNS